MNPTRVVISGCSGGGKSSLLAELARRGYAVVEEPGRRVVRAEQDRGGSALPWTDMAAFARAALDMAVIDFDGVRALAGPVFFDRGIVDAAAALEHATGQPALTRYGTARRYARTVFLAPPWPEIYATDPERRHGFDQAVAEHERLAEAYPALGYRTVTLPKASLIERADFVLAELDGERSPAR